MRTHEYGRAGVCCLLAAAVTLSGCTTPRPDPGLACNLYARTIRALPPPPPPPPVGTETQATRAVQAKASDATLRVASLQAQIGQSFEDRQALKRDRRPLKPPPVPLPPGRRPRHRHRHRLRPRMTCSSCRRVASTARTAAAF